MQADIVWALLLVSRGAWAQDELEASLGCFLRGVDTASWCQLAAFISWLLYTLKYSQHKSPCSTGVSALSCGQKD